MIKKNLLISIAAFCICGTASSGLLQEKSTLVGRMEVHRTGMRLAFLLVDTHGVSRPIQIPEDVLACANGIKAIEGRWVIVSANLRGAGTTATLIEVADEYTLRQCHDPILRDRLPDEKTLASTKGSYSGPVTNLYESLKAGRVKPSNVKWVDKPMTAKFGSGIAGFRLYPGADARHYYLLTQSGNGIAIDEVQEDRLTPLSNGEYLSEDVHRIPNPFGGQVWYPGQAFRAPGGAWARFLAGDAVSVNPAGAAGNVVTNTKNTGAGSLRNAIAFCNTNNSKFLNFNIPKTDPLFLSNVFIIGTTGSLPQITVDQIHVQGSTQTNFTGNTNPAGPEIFLLGSTPLDSNQRAFDFNGSSDSIDHVSIARFGASGILFRKGLGHVQSCFVGVSKDGKSAIGNGFGILAQDAPNTTIGGTLADRCIVSGNNFGGIAINNSTACVVKSNFIGTDVTGLAAIPNGDKGIEIDNDCSGTFIGGSAVDSTNLISGNKGHGVVLFNGKGVTVQNNLIGTDLTGLAALPNTKNGINVLEGEGPVIKGNLISGNGLSGILASKLPDPAKLPGSITVAGNLIGTTGDGEAALPNQIGIQTAGIMSATIGGTDKASRNIISGNTGDGITIQSEGTSSTVIRGNFIGCDADSTKQIGNGSFGIEVSSSSQNVHIGGTGGAGNVVSGNRFGIAISGANVTVDGNFIGLSASGALPVANTSGILVMGATAKAVKIGVPGSPNVVCGNTEEGIELIDAIAVVVQANLVGILPSGTAMPNGGNGVRLEGNTKSCQVGGAGTGEGNIISGNGLSGISIDGGPVRTFTSNTAAPSANKILGNLIGVDQGQTKAVPNMNGIFIRQGSSHNIIGGSTAESANVISGNTNMGVFISDGGSDLNSVQGNAIGGNRTGTASIPNGSNGVGIAGGAKTNVVGTVRRNLIFGNKAVGLRLSGANTSGNIVRNNDIRQNTLGQVLIDTGATSNTVQFNAITTTIGRGAVIVNGDTTVGNNLRRNAYDVGNRLLVDLGGDGNTANDTKDADKGPNNLQNNANINTATLVGGVATFTGTLPATPNQTFSVDVYLVDQPSTSGHGGQMRLLLSLSLTTNATGIATFSKSLSVTGTPKGLCTQVVAANGDTSEFGVNRLF